MGPSRTDVAFGMCISKGLGFADSMVKAGATGKFANSVSVASTARLGLIVSGNTGG